MLYKLGNCLRGGFQGEFDSIDDAWIQLGTDFLLAYPCDVYNRDTGQYDIDPNGSRSVVMYVKQENTFGIVEFVKCKIGRVSMTDRNREEIQHEYLQSVFF